MNTRTLLLWTLMTLSLAGGTLPSIGATAEPLSKTEGDDVQEARTFHIMTRTKEDAERARRQVRGDSPESLLQSFKQVARRVSIDHSSSKLGGDLGMVREGEMAKEFERAVYSVAVNQVSEPIQSPFG